MKLNKLKLQKVLAAAIWVSLGLTSTWAVAETSEDVGPERVQITNPDELEILGYSRNATNIWKMVHEEPLPDRSTMAEDQRESTMGGGLTRRTTYSGFEFLPLTDDEDYVKGPSFLMQNGALASLRNTPSIFEVQVQMPDESTWQWLDIFGFHDAAGKELRMTVLSRCAGSIFEAANPVETVLATRTITDTGGNFWQGPGVGGVVINNDLCSYHVRAVFWTDTTAPSVQMQLIKVRTQYNIPASLAPLIFQDRFEGS